MSYPQTRDNQVLLPHFLAEIEANYPTFWRLLPHFLAVITPLFGGKLKVKNAPKFLFITVSGMRFFSHYDFTKVSQRKYIQREKQ